MPSSKKHVYLEKTNDLILIFFFLNSDFEFEISICKPHFIF
jgi:hypothetical protein